MLIQQGIIERILYLQISWKTKGLLQLVANINMSSMSLSDVFCIVLRYAGLSELKTLGSISISKWESDL